MIQLLFEELASMSRDAESFGSFGGMTSGAIIRLMVR